MTKANAPTSLRAQATPVSGGKAIVIDAVRAFFELPGFDPARDRCQIRIDDPDMIFEVWQDDGEPVELVATFGNGEEMILCFPDLPGLPMDAIEILSPSRTGGAATSVLIADHSRFWPH